MIIINSRLHLCQRIFSFEWLEPHFNLVINVFESMKQLHAFQYILSICFFLSFYVHRWVPLQWYMAHVYFSDWGDAFTHQLFTTINVGVKIKCTHSVSSHDVFGTFNNWIKITPRLLRWKNVPGGRASINIFDRIKTRISCAHIRQNLDFARFFDEYCVPDLLKNQQNETNP